MDAFFKDMFTTFIWAVRSPAERAAYLEPMMSSRTLHHFLWITALSVALVLWMAVLMRTTPYTRPSREAFETLCEQGIRRSPAIIGDQVVQAVTFNYNIKGGKRPPRADFGGFSVAFHESSTRVSGYCRSNSTGTDVVLSELSTVRF